MFKKTINKFQHSKYKYNPKNFGYNTKDFYKYKKTLLSLNIRRSPRTEVLVVVHVYYPEGWPIIANKLKNLTEFDYDIVITMPKKNENFSKDIYNDFPNAYIVQAPNRGRDVLPFMKVAQTFKLSGYKYLLKLHTKKSTHRTDGQEWFEDMISNLLPTNPKLQNSVFKTLCDPKTGLIGPKGQYLQLTVNFHANGLHMTRILNKLYDKPTSTRFLQVNRKEYGFFAGSMFWTRIDSIDQLLKVHISDFEREYAQIDATYAHALERLFSIVSEIEDRNLYELSLSKLEKINYKTDYIPDWSDVYIGPK